MPRGIVYMAKHRDGRVYIGSTARSLNVRIANHFTTADSRRGHPTRNKWHQILLDTEYDPSALHWSVLEHVDFDHRQELFTREAWWIQRLDAIKRGFNSRRPTPPAPEDLVHRVERNRQTDSEYVTADRSAVIQQICTLVGLKDCEQGGQRVTRINLAEADATLVDMRKRLKSLFDFRMQGRQVKQPTARALDTVNLVLRTWSGMELVRDTRKRKRVHGVLTDIQDFVLQPVAARSVDG